MNFIRLGLIIIIIYVLNTNLSNSLDFPIYNSHQTVNRDVLIRNGSLSNAFQLKIVFIDENYEYTHTFNNGGSLILVEVRGNATVLSDGKLNQIYGNYDCSITSNVFSLSGNIDIERTITFFGNKKVSEIKTALRDDIIETIKNEIKQI